MAHKVLYRVFRPRIFDDVYGQKHITDVLKRQVVSGNISHAYLFSGPRGTGKTSTAKILAMALNCQNNQNGNPCLVCEACKEAYDEKLVDIVEIDAASNNGVENIRDIREKVSLLPVIGKYKVYIIDEVHMLSGGAFNALLKTLEEPPEHAVFILATTEPRKVPKTILSRCQQYDFKRIRTDEIIKRLAFVANESGIKYEEKALSVIARASEGAMRDALSMLDMCSTYGDVTEKSTAEIIGMPDSENTGKLVGYILDEQPEEAVAMAEQMILSGVECENILRDSIAYMGDYVKDCFNDRQRLNKLVYSVNILIEASGTIRYASVPKAKMISSIVAASLPECTTEKNQIEIRLASLEKKVEKFINDSRLQSPKNVQSEVKPKQTLSQAVDAYNKAEKENLLQEENKVSNQTNLKVNDAESEEDKLDKLRTAFKID